MPTFTEPPSIDMTAPTVQSFNPADKASAVAVSANIVLTFSESIARGSGNIVLKSAAGAVVATYDAASSTNLSLSGSTLTIKPTIDLTGGTGYSVAFASGSIIDMAGNKYAGTTSYNFTTIAVINQTITGSAGTDTTVHGGIRASFTLTPTSSGFSLTDNTGATGTITFQSVERVKFPDGGIALDVGATQSAGETVLLLGAVLPGKLVFDATKQTLLGAAIDLFDQGYSLQTLSGAVMRLPIWDILTQKTAPTNTDIATYLLTNVNGVAPDAATLATAVAALNSETSFATQGNFLWHLAESSTNQTHVGLVGLATTGLAYGW